MFCEYWFNHRKMCKVGVPSFSNQQINSIIPFDKYDSDYLFYCLRYAKGYFQLIGGGTGSGKGIVNKTTFQKTRLFIIKEKDIQSKIATILNNYDQLIENNNKRIKLLEDMAESLYKEWFVRFRFPGYEKANTKFQSAKDGHMETEKKGKSFLKIGTLKN